MSGLDLDRVERTLHALLARDPRPVTYHDRSTGEVVPVTPEAASSRAGLSSGIPGGRPGGVA